MYALRIKTNKRQMDQMEMVPRRLRKRIKPAMTRALTRACSSGKAYASKLIRKEYTMKAAAANRALYTRKTVWRISKLSAAVIARARPLNLANYRARQTKRGVTVQVRKSGGRALCPGAFLHGAYGWHGGGRSGGMVGGFNAPGNKKKVMFRRQGKERLPLRTFHGPSMAGILSNRRIRMNIIGTTGRKYKKRFDHEIGRILKAA